jgi:ubiquilin
LCKRIQVYNNKMEAEKVSISVKITRSNETMSVEVYKNQTTKELKEACATKLGESAESIKLIYKGRVLKDNEPISIIEANTSVFLVRNTNKEENPAVPQNLSTGTGELTGLMYGLNHFGVMNQATSLMESLPDISGIEGANLPDPQMLRFIFANPVTKQAFINMMTNMMTNPTFRDSLFNSNPQLRQVADRHPEIRQAMGNPEAVQQAVRMLERLAESPSVDGPMGGRPGTFPAPGGSPQPGTSSSAPSSSAQQTGINQPPSSQPSSQQASQPQFPMFPNFMNMFGNPQAQPSSAQPQGNAPQMPNLFNMFGGMQAQQPAQSNSPAPPSNFPQFPNIFQMFQPPNMQAGQVNNPPSTSNVSQPIPNVPNPPAFNVFDMFRNLSNPSGQAQSSVPNANTQAPAFNPAFPMFNPVFSPRNIYTAATDLRTYYSTQLQHLRDMGFTNEEANIRALQAAGGNVNAAVERLLNMLG